MEFRVPVAQLDRASASEAEGYKFEPCREYWTYVDVELDLAELKRLLLRVRKTLPNEPNRVRSAMNGFVIAVGTYVQPLADLALQTAHKIGKVSVDVGDTSCKVPYAPDYIEKIQKRGTVGKKRKTAKC